MKRRKFIRHSTLVSASVILFKRNALQYGPTTKIYDTPNLLPEWRGFNLRDFNSPDPKYGRKTTEEHFKWMNAWGFDFIRLPVAYPHYLRFDRTKDITPDEVYQIDEAKVEKIETLIYQAQKHQLHVSFNLHRAPGYCINAGFHEPYNLWKDKEAQNAFNYHWNFWAKRFKETPKEKISFDLLNEPVMREDMNNQLSPSSTIPVDLYKTVMKGATDAIRTENPARIVIADGNNIGNDPVPELKTLGIAQSCRGYFPHWISHYKAPWANKNPENMPLPVYPGTTGHQYADRKTLEKYYKPWIDLKNSGVGIHCGECGSWNKTPHDVVLNWFTDVVNILSENKIGFALWEFIGEFGILNSGRTDVDYENWHGLKLDRKLLNVIQKKI